MKSRRLEIEIIKERLLVWVPAVMVFIFCVGIFAYLKLPPSGASSNVQGEVVGLRSVEGDGVRHLLVVRLKNGSEILAEIPDATYHYRKGKTVNLVKKESSWLKGAKYYFGNYVQNET